MDKIDRRAILARDSARGCSPDFFASCMAIRLTGTGSRPSRSRGPSKRPIQRFTDQYKAMTLRRRSEPADMRRVHEGDGERDKGLTLRSGIPILTPRDQPIQSHDHRVILSKRSDKMSDDETKDQGQPSASSSKEFHSCRQSSSTTRKRDETTSRSSKHYQTPWEKNQSSDSRKNEKNSNAGTPKRSRDPKPQEDSQQAKKKNVINLEPGTTEFQPDWTAGSGTDLENMEMPDNQPDEAMMNRNLQVQAPVRHHFHLTNLHAR